MASQPPKTIVYFDGSCPLCRSEIRYYLGQDQSGLLCFVDVSESAEATLDGISQRRAMESFHVRASDGRILSGAPAFIEVWTHLPKLAWAARIAALPGALDVLELGYRLFLPVRPFISRLFGGARGRQTVIDGAKRR